MYSLKRLVKNKIFFRFFITYLIIMFIPIILGIIVYNISYNSLENYAIKANTAVLTQAKSVLEKQVDEINHIVMLLSNDNTVRSYLHVKNPYQPTSVNKMFSLKKELKAYQEVNNLILNYFILYRNSNMAYTSNLVYKISELYPDTFNYEGINFNQWYKEMFNRYYYNKYLSARDIIYHDKKYSALTYLHSLGYSSKPDALFLVLLDNDYIKQVLSGINTSNGGWVSLVDEKGQVLSTTNSGDIDTNNIYINLKKESGTIQKKIKGQKYIITYVNSNYNGWKYIAAQPLNIVMNSIKRLKEITLIVIVFTLILGLSTAFILTSKNTKPIQEMLGFIKEKMGEDDNKGFNYLKESISKIINNNKELEESLVEQKKYLKSSFLDKLLNGEYKSGESIKRMLKYSGINIKGQYFAVVLLEVTNKDINKEEIIAREEVLEELNIKRVIIKDLVMNYVMPVWENCIIHNINENTLVLIMEFEHNDGNWCQNNINKIVSFIYQKLKSDYDISLKISIGSLCHQLMDIARSYEEARRAINYKLDQRNENIRWYNEIEIDSCRYYYPLELETRLIKSIRNGNDEQVKDVLNSIYKENFKERNLSYNNYKKLLSEIEGSIYKLLEQFSWEEDKEFHDVENMLNKLDSQKEINNKYSYLEEIINGVCKLVNKHKNSYYEILKNRILKYTRNNYQDEDFSLSMIANKFDLTEVYISNLFKEYIGENYSTYLKIYEWKEPVVY